MVTRQRIYNVYVVVNGANQTYLNFVKKRLMGIFSARDYHKGFSYLHILWKFTNDAYFLT